MRMIEKHFLNKFLVADDAFKKRFSKYSIKTNVVNCSRNCFSDNNFICQALELKYILQLRKDF